MAFEYLETLNPEQTEAVVHSGNPLLILAGAGSGKTRVITTKIAYLIQHENMNPYSILAVTFTKKAAREMQERAEHLEPLAARAQIRTFHSFGSWFLRRYAEEAGLEPSFTVYDDDDSASLIMKAMPGMTKKQANSAAHKIALCKDYCLSPEDDLSPVDSDGAFSEVYAAYQKRLRATGNADFGDLIMLPVKILESNPAIRKEMQYRFRVIMVDEYQDSNVAQFKLLQAISGVQENSGTYVCVVGDDDQSIYKFRGAEVQNILQFPDFFPGASVIRLERNYRSTGKILAAADAVVSHNEDRLGKTLVAVRGEGSLPKLVFLESQDKEAQFCASLIKKAVEEKGDCSYRDFAILYRTNAQSLGFESEFLHRQIPYVVVGSLKFYEREEIKDSLAYLALVANGRDEIAFQRIVNKPVRGIGEKTQEKIIHSAYETAGALIENLNLIDAAENAAESFSKKARDGIKEFCGLMKELKDSLLKKSASSDSPSKTDELAALASGEELPESDTVRENLSVFVRSVIEESGLYEYHKAQDEIDGTARVSNLDELVNSAVLYPCTMQGLLDFLDSIELDRTLAENTEETADAVTLITLHNTKGLEFPRVIITGLENGIFPRGDKAGDELEEERRLFYVGITRAKDELYITSCAMRRLYGRTEPMMPSRFLFEAGDVFKVLGNVPPSYAFAGKTAGFDGNEVSEDDPKSRILKKYAKGTRIYNDDYGYGQIVECSAGNGEVVVTVQFESGGRKKFLPEYQSKSLEIIRD